MLKIKYPKYVDIKKIFLLDKSYSNRVACSKCFQTYRFGNMEENKKEKRNFSPQTAYSKMAKTLCIYNYI